MSCCVNITQRLLENYSKNQQMQQNTMNAVNGGTYVASTSFMDFHSMLDSLSRMNDKDKQQVCGNFRK